MGPLVPAATLSHRGHLRADDPGWCDDEGRARFEHNLETVVERYHGMRDAGDTTFDGRRAHAYTSGTETS